MSSAVSKMWHSPTPYLFGGITAAVILVAMALLILLCSDRKPSSSADGESPSEIAVAVQPSERRLVVIVMAGDSIPSYVATPCDQRYSAVIS